MSQLPNTPAKLNGCEVLPPMNPSTRPQTAATPSSKKRKSSRNKTGNRFEVLNAFVDGSMANLCRSEISVWMVLYRDTRNSSVCISHSNIARRTGLDRRTVGRAIKKLKKKGLVKIIFQGGLNRGPSRYKVLPEITSPANSGR